ncbi:hypothetical protein CEXT_102131, partial [Caerostris extrusa]
STIDLLFNSKSRNGLRDHEAQASNSSQLYRRRGSTGLNHLNDKALNRNKTKKPSSKQRKLCHERTKV